MIIGCLCSNHIAFKFPVCFRNYNPKMVLSSIFTAAHQPVRSISLPSRLQPETNSLKIESVLENLKSISKNIAPCRLDSIQNALVWLAELYNSVWGFLQSSSTQHALLHYQQGKVVEEELSESVVLIDSCSTARDTILMMKESIQILQSVLRRKGADSSAEAHIRAYFIIRRRAKKDVQKCLNSLKKMENNKATFPSSLDLSNHDLLSLIRLLREAKTISISIFSNLLAFLSEPVAKAKASNWSLISQLMPVILTSEKEGKMMKEVESVDVALRSLLSHLRSNTSNSKAEVQKAQRRLGTLAASFEGIEGRLDSSFRCLVKHRVCFLNMLAP